MPLRQPSRVLHRTLHRPPERNAPGELVGDALRDQRVELWLLTPMLSCTGVAGDLRQPGPQAIGLRVRDR
jgi:hypothetical protein